jgi:hypothetical protein
MQISFAWQLVYERVYGQWPASLVFDNVVFIMNLTVCVHALLTPMNRFLSKTYSLEDMAGKFRYGKCGCGYSKCYILA